MSDQLSILLSALDGVGVHFGSRNRTVAEATGYAEGSVRRLLSGNTPLTNKFIKAVCESFGLYDLGAVNLIVKSCGNCVFYWQTDSDFEIGQCRKEPPIITSESLGAFPSIRAVDWCGKFKPKK